MNAASRAFLSAGLMLWGVLPAFFGGHPVAATGANAAPVATVEGTLLDLPTAFPDGSLRFHLAVGPLAKDGGTIPVPVGGRRQTVPLFQDAFDSGAKTRWEDVLGASTIAEGRLAADSGRNDVLLRGFQERNVRVSVEAEAAAQMGILVRYQDSNNFVMAFYTPGAKLLGFHEAVDGNFGPWIHPVSTARFSGGRVHMVAEIEGDGITAALTDDEGHAARTASRIRRITAPGGIGLYHDTTTPAPQRFDHFRLARLERRVPADAVQVVVPESVLEENAVWPGGKHVRVTGREGRFQMPGGSLRTVTVARVEDIVAAVQEGRTGKTLFPTRLPNRRWVRFSAEGLDVPACGVIYRKGDTVTNGMPLGGIDTGATDLETSGMLGYTTIFNSHVPRRGPLNVPILGMSVAGRTWLLCDPQPKAGAGQHQRPLSDARFDLKLDGLETVDEIHYWGHYPVADLEFETDSPVGVGLRAWAPFLPGALVDSMLPGTVFEVHLQNETDASQEGTIAFSFPGPLDLEAGASTFTRRRVEGTLKDGRSITSRFGRGTVPFSLRENRDSPRVILRPLLTGVEVAAPLASYLVGVIGPDKPRLGGGLSKEGGAAWSKIAESLPPDDPSRAGASAAVDFSLAPGQSKVVRFLLAWSAPAWNAGGHHGADAPHRFTHMYAKHYPSALEAAETLAANHESLLERILAWQKVLYAEQSLPVWLRDSLVNNLHLIAEDGMWAAKRSPLPNWVREADGLFGMNECPRGCPQIECIPCSFYGNQPLVYFFPKLALSTLRGYKGYQYPDGAAVWIFGGCTGQTPPIDFANPTKGYQWATNGISLAAMVDRYYLCHGDREPGFVAEFYPMVKSNMIYTVNLRPEYPIGDRIIAMPTGNEGTEWFEAPEPGWRGMTAHVGGLHLAQLRIAERMAKLAGDQEFAGQCAAWITAGSESMEKKLWTGAYYLNYWEPETGSKSDLVFGYQLDGEWITDHHGLASALPDNRVTTVLETVKRCNVAVTKYGAVNYTSPDGTPAQVKGYGTYSYFPPEALMLAMTYMYNGQREFGVELARKVWHNIVCLQGYTWDMPNIMRGDVDTGERTFGNDYYQDMMLWSLPAAMEGEDFGAPAKPGGLVDRVIQAARG